MAETNTVNKNQQSTNNTPKKRGRPPKKDKNTSASTNQNQNEKKKAEASSSKKDSVDLGGLKNLNFHKRPPNKEVQQLSSQDEPSRISQKEIQENNTKSLSQQAPDQNHLSLQIQDEVRNIISGLIKNKVIVTHKDIEESNSSGISLPHEIEDNELLMVDENGSIVGSGLKSEILDFLVQSLKNIQEKFSEFEQIKEDVEECKESLEVNEADEAIAHVNERKIEDINTQLEGLFETVQSLLNKTPEKNKQETSLENLQKEINNIKQALYNTQKEKKEIESKISSFDKTLELISNLVQNLSDKEATNETITNMQERREIDEKIDNLIQQLQKEQLEIESVKNYSKDNISEIEALNKRYEKLQSRYNTLLEKVDEVSRENFNLKNEAMYKVENIKAEIMSEIKQELDQKMDKKKKKSWF